MIVTTGTSSGLARPINDTSGRRKSLKQIRADLFTRASSDSLDINDALGRDLVPLTDSSARQTERTRQRDDSADVLGNAPNSAFLIHE